MQSYIPILFILLAVAMVVGPVMLIRPSKGQNRIAKLRLKAAQAGMSVHIGEVKDSNGRNLADYLLPFKRKSSNAVEWMLKKQTFSHDAHFYHEWDWKGKALALSAEQKTQLCKALVDAPVGIYALGCNSAGLFATWSESCAPSEESVAIAALCDWLEGVRDCLGAIA